MNGLSSHKLSCTSCHKTRSIILSTCMMQRRRPATSPHHNLKLVQVFNHLDPPGLQWSPATRTLSRTSRAARPLQFPPHSISELRLSSNFYPSLPFSHRIIIRHQQHARRRSLQPLEAATSLRSRPCLVLACSRVTALSQPARHHRRAQSWIL